MAGAGKGGARIAVFCSGYGSNFQAILDAVRKKKLRGVEIALMACDKPGAYAIERARKHDVPVVLVSPKLFPDRKEYEKVLVRILKSQRVDWIVLAGFMRILTPYFIGAYRGRILNIHPSYLPAFKGAHAIRDAFEAGVKSTGVTVHHVTAEVDAGKPILQQKVPVKKGDTLASLEKRIHAVEHLIYPKAVQRVIDGKRR